MVSSVALEAGRIVVVHSCERARGCASARANSGTYGCCPTRAYLFVCVVCGWAWVSAPGEGLWATKLPRDVGEVAGMHHPAHQPASPKPFPARKLVVIALLRLRTPRSAGTQTGGSGFVHGCALRRRRRAAAASRVAGSTHLSAAVAPLPPAPRPTRHLVRACTAVKGPVARLCRGRCSACSTALPLLLRLLSVHCVPSF